MLTLSQIIMSGGAAQRSATQASATLSIADPGTDALRRSA